MVTIPTTLILLAAWLAAGKPSPAPSPKPGTSRPPEPGDLAHRLLASVLGWLHAHAALLVFAVVLTVAIVAAVCVARRALWRRAVAAGTWVEVVPPRQTPIGQSAAAWKLLSSLVVRAQGGWHLVKPPLAMEVHGDGGRLALTVWVPAWITTSAVATEVRMAWPGATTRPFTPPTGGDGWHAAGYHLIPTHTDLGPLVDETSMGRDARDADPLRPVFDALRHLGGPNVLQVLARPAGDRRINALASAARRPAKPRRPIGVHAADLVVKLLLWLLRTALDLLQNLGYGSRRRTAGGEAYRPPDALQRAQMRRAADKLAAGPHLLVAIRTLAVRPARAYARAEARTVAHGYAVATKLRPRRLRRALWLVTERYAHRGHWLLATASELGVLFHFPADPARHGFPVAALTRPFPTDAAEIHPERPTAHTSGWTGHRWSAPKGLAIIDDEPDEIDPIAYLTTHGDHHDER
ncbi:hypothetical protein HDA40_005471 [Hamadaea flava]|uniref:Type VII secretion protein EccE n=1 Tax=Hamadaea flava TaxID=1742688 RepID=A0ABV8LZG8_9ACTN|nr:hypothetical protein [Hamadaea flava]MCP2326964.1 hypothetical protein [Hamadaea flava]